jgi:hypothetical protein
MIALFTVKPHDVIELFPLPEKIHPEIARPENGHLRKGVTFESLNERKDTLMGRDKVDGG